MDLDTLVTNADARDWQTVDPESIDPLRFAVVGTGWFTRHVSIPGIMNSDFCEIAVVVAVTEAEAVRVAADVGPDVRGLSTEAFLETGSGQTDGYDAVYISTPNMFHLTYTEAAAERGKHVLCEKPMERDSDRAERMVDACEDAGVELAIAYRTHTEPAARRARELIASGIIGDPVEVRGSMTQRLLHDINPDPDQWRLDAELAGGGALFDVGIYPLNTARFLLDADPVAVVGRTRASPDAFADVDASVTFTVEFPGDVYASCFASQNARQDSAIYVTGTEGRVGIEPAFFPEHRRVLHLSHGDGRASIEFEPVDQLTEEFDFFAHQIKTGATVSTDGEHGLVDMYAMEAIYESAERREWVRV
jgi:xylose dehydrogenase (NAD/NADP)